MKKRLFFGTVALVLVTLICGGAFGQEVVSPPISIRTPAVNITSQSISDLAPGQAPLPQQMTPQQADAYQKLSPAQQGAVQSELGKAGGRLTPAAIEALKARPEFKGLSPDDIAKGRQMLEQKEGGQERKGKEKTRPITDKNVIGGQPSEKSLFDRSREIGKYQDISVALRPFGYEFFSEAAVRVTTDRKDIPVPLKYVIGPGDEVKLLLWGRVNAQYTLTVDRDGKITIPQIGPIFVAGMNFEDMSKQIIKQSEQIVGTSVDISMGSLKTIPIFVLGDVRRPGSYTIGSFATITDALLIAGGPTEIGSMRNVQLKRQGRLITTFDLYDLLLKGDKSKDMTLMAGDVVFVPVTGALVGIAGNVKRPAIYELRGRFDLESLIELAGGIIPTAYTQQLQVERIIRNERQVVVDINDKNLERAAQMALQDADLVKIFSIVDMNVNAVYLNGNVKRPGKYEIKAGMKLGDLLKGVDDLLSDTYFDYALIKRLKPPEMEAQLIPFNLGNLLLKKDESANIELKAQDQVFVFNQWFFREKPAVTIEGEIRGDCINERATRTTTGEAGSSANPGALSDADLDAIGMELKTMEENLRTVGMFDLANMVRDANNNIRAEGRISPEKIRILKDELTKGGFAGQADRMRAIENKARIVCELPLVDNLRIKDVILMAGGLTNASYLERGEIIRTSKKKDYSTIYFNVAKAMEGHSADNLALQDADRIVIHSIWEQVYKKNVAVDGDVAKPGNYQFTEGMTVRDLVFKGGNILESAYVDEAEISSISSEGRLVSKTERKVINLRKALEGDPQNNLPLKPNDRLLVKRIPEWGGMKFVTVTGEFKFPGRYTMKKGEKLTSLIERAGGYTENAYLRGAYFKRESVRQLQQRSLDEMAQRMQRELLSSTSASVATSISSEEVQAKQAEAQLKQRLIEYMKSLRATGRMTIAVTNVRMLKGSSYDIELEDGDNLYLPQKSSVVNVVGAVMSEGSHIFNEKWDYQDYIGVAGGYARYADTSNVFVIKVDGSARKLGRGFAEWSDKRDRWELAAYGEEIRQIEPGDVIVVPEKIAQIAWLREVRDITQILMNTAVVAATVIKLF